MAIPTTNNQTALFLTQKPAWEAGVQLEQTMDSDVQTARAGLEQRQQRSSRGRFKISYVAFLSKVERSARAIRAQAEIKSSVWVPFWTEAGVTATAIASNTFSMDRVSSPDFFTPGDWILFDSPTQGQQFRQIDGIGTTDQELILVALVSGIAFNVLTPIYPCRRCARMGGNAEFDEASEDTHVERLSYQTL